MQYVRHQLGVHLTYVSMPFLSVRDRIIVLDLVVILVSVFP